MILSVASDMISDGSELLLLVPSLKGKVAAASDTLQPTQTRARTHTHTHNRSNFGSSRLTSEFFVIG